MIGKYTILFISPVNFRTNPVNSSNMFESKFAKHAARRYIVFKNASVDVVIHLRDLFGDISCYHWSESFAIMASIGLQIHEQSTWKSEINSQFSYY